jgi:pilus assembly protein Flp/PilA
MHRLMSLYVGKLAAIMSDRRAATAIEYGLIASLIVVVIVVGVRAVGNNVFSNFYNEIATALS